MNKFRSINDVTKLSNGVLMPWFGLGVWQASGDEVVDAVKWAIDGGYRHIDGASVYGNEKEVGIGVKESSVSRHDIFITSKLIENGYQQAIDHCEQTLRDLQTDYVDLYLIHWPRPFEGSKAYVDAWKGFEKLYKDGKARAIGVANFYESHLQDIMDECEIVPMVNQFEYHPYYQMPELQAFCKKHNIQDEAYSPLAGGAIFKDDAFKPFAEKYGKSIAQIVLRFLLQTDTVVIPKSVKKERILDNAKIFDFEIDAADMEALKAMDQQIKITCARPDQQWPDFLKEKEERMAAGAPF